MKNSDFMTRLGFAIDGLREAWRSENSFRTHVAAAVALPLALIVLQPAPVWWALAGMAAASVLCAELFNTALETLADHVRPEIHPEIKRIKDMAAGAVLILSIASLWVAAFLLISLI